MAGRTTLDVMSTADRKILMEGVKAGKKWAVEFLETCLAVDTKGPALGTEQQEIEMVLESFEAHIQKPANNIVRFSREHSPEEQAAAIAAGNSGLSL
jgi:hypothetical protein